MAKTQNQADETAEKNEIVEKEQVVINENDIVDTKDATNVANYTFQVIVTGTQIQPQA